MQNSTQVLQEHISSLLLSGQVACAIGYELNSRNKTRPVFVSQTNEVDRLVWNNHSTFNLTRYLPEALSHFEGKVAILVKPCDSKTLNVLINENKIVRDRVHVIGIECHGILDDSNRLQSRCEKCDLAEPLIFDYLVEVENETIEALPQDRGVDLSVLEGMTSSERMAYWFSQFDRCLRCYACRQVCPICDCPTCLYERDDSLWCGAGIGVREKRAFHLGRAYHLAGRCIGCNECERVCPVNIKISLLNQKLAEELELRFGFRAGMNSEPSPLTTVLLERE